MIDLKTLKQLVKLMVDNELTEVDLEGDSDKVRLRRPGSQPQVQYVQPTAASPAPAAAPAPQPAAPIAPSAPAPAAEPADSGPSIDSPMVGTFYTAATPDAEAFVKPGDRVTADTVVCIIEAMKVFNEIKAETAGTIEKVLVSNGEAVEFGQPLFRIKPG